MDDIYRFIEEMDKPKKDILFICGCLADLQDLKIIEGGAYSATDKGLIGYQILRDTNYQIDKKSAITAVKQLFQNNEPEKEFFDILWHMVIKGREKMEILITKMLNDNPELKDIVD